MSLMEKIMNVCEQQMACADVFCPYLACSFGAHIFNLHNNVGIEKKYPETSDDNKGAANICSGGLKPRNVKLNIILVSPPGLSKNESINRFIDKKYGILSILNGKLDILPDGNPAKFCKVNGEITSAGLSGSVKAITKDNDIHEEFGDALLYRKGILAYYEVASLFIKSEHSQDLVNHLLRIMGDNVILKRMAHVDISHDTWVTIWGGIQPARILNIDNSGIDRRALFLFHDWTNEEITKIKEFRAKQLSSEEIKKLQEDFALLKTDILEFVEDVKNITKVIWTFDRLIYADMPADLDLIEGLCIGYNLLSVENITETLELKIDETLRKMLVDMKKMKDDLKFYEELITVIPTIQQTTHVSTRDMYKNYFRRMGYTYSKCRDTLYKARSLGLIDTEDGKVHKGHEKWKLVS